MSAAITGTQLLEQLNWRNAVTRLDTADTMPTKQLTDATYPNSESKAKFTFWILQVLVALAFLAAGISKLTGQAPMVEIFSHIGVGQWFRYVTGGIEVIAAVVLLVPRLVPVGALLLVGTMAGAVPMHLLVIGGSPVPPLVLLILVAVIAWGRKQRLNGLFKAKPTPSAL